MANHNAQVPGQESAPPDRLLTREILTLAAVVVLGAIMTILDATIVNVALPTLGRDFNTSISTIQWVPTIYLLAVASVIPLSGWASERFGASGWPRLPRSCWAHCCAGCRDRWVS